MMLALWGIESAYGDPLVQKNHMRPVFPALAALAWGEPRRRTYWEQELINALRIVERGWVNAGRDARLLGRRHGPHPMDAGSLAQHRHGLRRRRPRLTRSASPTMRSARPRAIWCKRGKYRRGEHWGYEVRAPGRSGGNASRSYAAWHKAGVARADGKPFPQPRATAKLWVPVPGGPAFLLGPQLLRGAVVQPVDELHARRSCISATASWAAAHLCRDFPAASARRRSPRCRKSSAA